jgi:membrane fusion protein (multidrug efflux system)
MQNVIFINDALGKTMMLRACMAALVAGTVLTGMLAGGCSNSASDTPDAARPAAVTVTPVVRGDIALAIEVSGTIAPVREVFIGPRVSGRIDELCAEVGDYVEQGRTLVRLEQVRFKLAHDEALAALREGQAQRDNLQRRLARTRDLYEQGVADKQLYDDMVTEVELARARVDMASAKFDLCREDYADTVLNAPFAGFVVERRFNSGEMFSSKDDYVFHLVDTGTVKVEVHVFETRRRHVQVGMHVPVTVDAAAGSVFDGRITVVNPRVDPASRKFLAKIEIPNPEYLLQTGMFARVNIPAESRRGVLLVPAAAVIERDGRAVVFVADGLTAGRREVSVGLQDHAMVEITGGVNEGERVIVNGLYAVKDGTPLVIEGT